jgi:hypothetical protein
MMVAGTKLLCHLVSTVEIRRVAFAHPDVAGLVAEVQAEYTRLYGGPDESPLEDDVFEAA